MAYARGNRQCGRFRPLGAFRRDEWCRHPRLRPGLTSGGLAKRIELRRHTANDGDVLTDEGITAAIAIGRRLDARYTLVASSGAQRSTQTAACILAAVSSEVPLGVIVEPALRSDVEDRWRAAYQKAGAGDLAFLESADPELVADDSARLAVGLENLFNRLPENGRALAIGHSPTNEAAVLGLTGEMVAPLGKGEGVLITMVGDGYTVEPAL
ncbi:MAG: hypothetical protein GEU79_18595 [Acidimicrobiia bacterium]|nr:hypothetical protein [Acidimicrobiia bacterium]